MNMRGTFYFISQITTQNTKKIEGRFHQKKLRTHGSESDRLFTEYAVMQQPLSLTPTVLWIYNWQMYEINTANQKEK